MADRWSSYMCFIVRQPVLPAKITKLISSSIGPLRAAWFVGKEDEYAQALQQSTND